MPEAVPARTLCGVFSEALVKEVGGSCLLKEGEEVVGVGSEDGAQMEGSRGREEGREVALLDEGAGVGRLVPY